MIQRTVSSLLIIYAALSFTMAFAEPPNLFYGDEVLVTGSKLPVLLSKSPWSSSVMDQDEIRSLGLKDLPQALEHFAGVDVKRNGGIGSVASAKIRGSTYQQVLVMVDGVRVNSPLLGGVQLEDILLENVDRIELVRSPISALYGSDAVGGAINIITKSAVNHPVISAKYESGSYGLKDYVLNLNTRVSNWNGSLRINKLGQNGFRVNSATDQTALEGLFEGSLPVGLVSISLKDYLAEKGVPGVPDTAADPYSASTPNDSQKDYNQNYRVGFSRGGLNLTAYQNQWDQYFHSRNPYTGDFDDSRYLARQNGLELADFKDYDQSKLSYGLDYREDSGTSQYVGSHQIHNYGAYIQDQVTPNDAVSVTMGLRGDHHSVSGKSFNPRIGVIAALAPQLNLRSSLSYAFRNPTINDLYWNDPIWQMYGDTALRPEKTTAFELGALTQPAEGLDINLNYFNSDIHDLILWDYDPSTNITRAKNSGAAKVSGWELEYRNKLSSYWKMVINYTWQKGEDQGLYPGRLLAYTPEKKGNVTLFYDGDVFNWSLSARYVGERYADGANSISLPEYTVADFGIRVDGPRTHLKLQVDNLFNAAYYESIGYHPVTYATMRYPMPGRVITAGVQVDI